MTISRSTSLRHALLRVFAVSIWATAGIVAGAANAQTPSTPADLSTDLTNLIAYTPAASPKTPITDANILAARDALDAAVASPEKLDAGLRGRLDTLLKERGDVVQVTRKTPVSETDPLRWVLVNYRSSLLHTTPTAQVTAAPEAVDFPGVVPSDTPTVKRTVTIDGTTDPSAWRSTGLYAAPGALVTVSTSAAIAGKGLQIRVGAQADSLRNRQHHRYVRLPEISRTFPFEGGTTQVANAFGGLIYIMLPGGAKLGTFNVTIDGAVEAPCYIEGVTTAAEWKTLREAPAPWGEIEAKNVIFTVPSSQLRTLDDPAKVTAFWDHIISTAAEFTGRPAGILSYAQSGPSRAERYVPDVDISVGYMHSGYPIMTMLDATVDNEVNPDLFTSPEKSKRWGIMHELGHDYQTQAVGKGYYRDWTPSDCGEVTNNMVPLYIADTLGMKWQVANSGLLKSQKAAEDMWAAGQKPWTSPDLFVKLFFFVQLEDGLGWQPLHQVMTEEYNLPVGQHPKTDQEKRDQWLVRLSKASGKNLGPFFEKWGFETSDAARASVASLPEWMPKS